MSQLKEGEDTKQPVSDSQATIVPVPDCPNLRKAMIPNAELAAELDKLRKSLVAQGHANAAGGVRIVQRMIYVDPKKLLPQSNAAPKAPVKPPVAQSQQPAGKEADKEQQDQG